MKNETGKHPIPVECYYQSSFEDPGFDCSKCSLDAIEEPEAYCGAECLECGGVLIAIPKGNRGEEVWYQCDNCEHGFSGE